MHGIKFEVITRKSVFSPTVENLPLTNVKQRAPFKVACKSYKCHQSNTVCTDCACRNKKPKRTKNYGSVIKSIGYRRDTYMDYGSVIEGK